MIARKQSDIEVLREGGGRIARHLAELAKKVGPGATARELEDAARAMVERDGDEAILLGYKYDPKKPPYHSALCVSVNDTIVHSPAADNRLVFLDGDVVSLDFVIKHRGLCVDAAVTVIAGTARPEDERLVDATYEALEAGIAVARAGKTTGDIGYAVEGIARKHGLGFPKNLSGHGIGKNVHEPPHVPNYGKPREGDELVTGMVITIEPMFTLGSGELYLDADGHGYRTKDGSRTAHAEHTILVTENGSEILTKV